MQTCKRCHVQIRGDKRVCPLCGSPVSGTPEKSPFPVLKRRIFTRLLILRIALFLMIAVLIILPVVQYFAGRPLPWVPLAMISAVIGFADVSFTLYYRNNALKTIHVQLYIGILVCLVVDKFTGWHRWSVTWSVPAIFLGLIAGTILTGLILRAALQDFVLYILLDTLLSAIQFLFLYMGWNTNPIFAVCSIMAEILFFLGILIFRWRDFESASERYFNV